ncbi:hypothetical protein [Lewinella sp. IMCC34183]|uniref:hypothetical protein n=1 Tax=Lewinella sp. IMCC34183 TaxID=2248762 RepID=UPI000E283981|nr:hypothetical protein [Lewinella sp. IMCC34183]
MNTHFTTLFPNKSWWKEFNQFALLCGLVLLAVDALFLLLHLALNFGYLSDRRFHIEVDSGFAEQFQYLKFFTCSFLFLVLAVKTRSALRLVMGLLIGFLLLEDAFSIHEDIYLVGERIMTIDNIGNLSKAQTYELIYGLVVGGGLIGLLAITIVRTHDLELRQRALIITVLILILGGFGVVVDFGHAFLQRDGSSQYLESFVGIVEDWGEMITTSLIAMFVIDDVVRTLKRKNAETWESGNSLHSVSTKAPTAQGAPAAH